MKSSTDVKYIGSDSTMSVHEERFNRWLTSGQMIWEYDASKNEVWLSPALHLFLHGERSEHIVSCDCFLASFHAEAQKFLLPALSQERTEGCEELQVRGVDGSYRSLFQQWTVTPCKSFVLGTLQCRGSRDPLFQDSYQQAETIQAILDNTSAVIFVKDLEGRYLLLNKQYQALFALNKDIIGLTDYDVFPKEAADLFRKADRDVIEKGDVVELLERAPTGDEIRTYISTKVPLRDHTGAIYAVAGIATDITSEQKAKEELARIGKLKSEFLTNMSHEVRTPLNGVLVAVELLESGSLTLQQSELVQTIKDSTEMLLAVVNNILDFSHLEANKLVLMEDCFSPGQLFNRIVGVYKHIASSGGVSLHLEVDDLCCNEYYGDEVRLSQIVHNLIGNAVKFTGESGAVHVSVHMEQESDRNTRLVFSVDDTGIGIPIAQREHIFEPFVQGDASITRAYGGTGLGLSICHRLLTAMNGTIRYVEKTSPGSRFEVSLPLDIRSREKEDREEQMTLSVQEQERLSSSSILLVEDNEVNRRVTTKTLEAFVGSITHAENGKVALELLEERQFDVILMDIQMPGMDGIEATKRIRIREDGQRCPIIALTAHAIAGYKEELIAYGFSDYLFKPVRRQELLHVLLRCLPESSL